MAVQPPLQGLLRCDPTRHTAWRPVLAARGKTQAALRADLLRHLGVAESAKYSSMTVALRLDLTKNLSLSHAADFHHGLLDVSAIWLLRFVEFGATVSLR